MQPLNSVFAEPNPPSTSSSTSAPKRRANQTALRRTTKRWSRWLRQALGVFLFILLLFLAIGLFWAERTGRLDVWVLKSELWLENRLAAQGLAVPHVQVTGLGFTTHQDVRNALGAYDLEPLSRLNPYIAAQNLETLPWVLEARVQRLWPETLNIWIKEKTPLAILYQGDQSFVIDGRGQIISEVVDGMVYDLPSIGGKGSESAAPHLMQLLHSFPTIHDRFAGAHRLSNRRWDLYLSPGVKVNLPAGQTFEGLKKLQTLMQEYAILDKDIKTLDLRGKRPIIANFP